MQVEGCFVEDVLSDNTCTFLTEKKLCSIQERHGESYLSTTCSVFPRNCNMVNGKLELTLDMSCPQAANLALLNPNSMKSSIADIKDDSQIIKISTLKLCDGEYTNNIYPYFEKVRSFILKLLQNRNYCFEDRLNKNS